MRCIECPSAAVRVENPPPRIDPGRAGASARREHDRRLAKREAANKERWGERVGGWVTRFGVVPQSTAAWGIGARGEELLAEAFAKVPNVVALHDRKVLGTRGNIDHIVVAPAGVFVVDAKHIDGLIEVRDYGGFFRTDLRLTVGRRNKSHLARNMDSQVDAVLEALNSADLLVPCEVKAVLCFVEGSWPIFRPPSSFENVYLESDRSIGRRLSAPVVHMPEDIDHMARILAVAFPPK
jgi:hypothetical protein